jgi:hypothetical protein
LHPFSHWQGRVQVLVRTCGRFSQPSPSKLRKRLVWSCLSILPAFASDTTPLREHLDDPLQLASTPRPVYIVRDWCDAMQNRREEGSLPSSCMVKRQPDHVVSLIRTCFGICSSLAILTGRDCCLLASSRLSTCLILVLACISFGRSPRCLDLAAGRKGVMHARSGARQPIRQRAWNIDM